MHVVARVALVITLLASPAEAEAQHGDRSTATTLAVDVIGPRTARSIRSRLSAHRAELAGCRTNEEALVRIAFALAPDGSVLSPRAVEDPDLDPGATECVLTALRTWRFQRSASSTTTVSWSIRLHATPTETDAPAEARTCFCFSWVHLADHGRTCEPTRRRCEASRRSSSRDSTACTSSAEASCEREAWIHGRYLRAR